MKSVEGKSHRLPSLHPHQVSGGTDIRNILTVFVIEPLLDYFCNLQTLSYLPCRFWVFRLYKLLDGSYTFVFIKKHECKVKN